MKLSSALIVSLGALALIQSLSASRAGQDRGKTAGASATDRFDTLASLFAQDAPVSRERVRFERTDNASTPCAFFPGKTMRRIGMEFVSQTFRGVEAKHQASLFLPEPSAANRAKGGVAIILGGDGIEAKDADHDWIESVVAGLGVPCLVVKESFSKEQFRVKNLGQLMSQGDRAFAETGDPREAGYYALARIFSAAATVATALPEVQATRFVATGSSKGGMAAMIVLAGDRRFVGAYPTAWNTGNIREATRLKGERWGWDLKPKETGPAGESARAIWQRFGDGRFQRFLDLFETARWGDALQGRFVMPAVGTNDPLFHLLSDQYYFDDLKADSAFLRIPNYGHGRGTADHALGWRHTVAAAFLGQRTPRVRIESETAGDRAAIYLALSHADHAAIREIRLFSTTDSTGDYREAKWESQAITAPSPRPAADRIQIAETRVPAVGTAAYYVRVTVQGEFCVAINSSNVIELGKPRVQALEPRP